jgi:hypothetical protein
MLETGLWGACWNLEVPGSKHETLIKLYCCNHSRNLRPLCVANIVKTDLIMTRCCAAILCLTYIFGSNSTHVMVWWWIFCIIFLHLYCRKCGTHKRMQIGEIKKEKCKYISQLIVAAKMEFYSTKKCCASRIYTDQSELLFLYFFKG